MTKKNEPIADKSLTSDRNTISVMAGGILRFIGLDLNNVTYKNDYLSQLSETTRTRLLTSYQESIELPKDKTDLSKYLRVYTNERQNLLNLFPIPITEDSNYTQLTASFASLDQALQDIGGRYHPDDLHGYLQSAREDAIGHIRTQHIQDIDAIKNSSLSTDERNSACKQLEEMHNAQLKAFEEHMLEAAKALQNAAQVERARVATFATMREMHGSNRNKFDELFRNKSRSIGITGSITGHIPGSELKNITLNDLVTHFNEGLRTVTNSNIKVTSNSDGTYTVHLQFQSSWLGYYGSNPEADYTLSYQILKMAGTEKPVCRLNGTNTKDLMAHAVEAYAGARNAGYKAEDLTFVINGESYTVDKLFEKTTAPQRRQAIDMRADEIAKGAGAGRVTQERIKNELESHKTTPLRPAASHSPTSSTAPPTAGSTSSGKTTP